MKNVTNARTPGFYWHKYFHFSLRLDKILPRLFSYQGDVGNDGSYQDEENHIYVWQFCNAILATTFGSKDAFEKHMEDTQNILTNLNVVMALHKVHPMTEEEKEKLMRTKRKELEQELGVKVEIGENETTVAEESEENQPTFQYPRQYYPFTFPFYSN